MKAQNREKPIPGCLGRMVNLFDLSTGVAGNMLLADKPYQYHDGSSLSRSRSDVTRMGSSFGEKIENKQIVSKLWRTSSNKKANGTPMKMLIDQEMSKEMECINSPPNVVAKLMGLDALPQQQPHSASQRCNMNNYSRSLFTNSEIPSGCWQEEEGLSERMLYESHQSPRQNVYKDVYEVWQQPQKSTSLRNKSPQKGRHNENIDDKKMALIHQKFVEAKRLATDEKLRQSKEFQDALEVLSSNKDLFVKFLQEPDSLFSQNLHDFQSAPPPETKRITVLKPSKMVETHKFSGTGKRSDKQIKKPTQAGQDAVWGIDNPEPSPILANQKFNEYPIQPTRIVVLKPSPGKTHEIMAVVSSPISSPRVLHEENIYEGLEDDDEGQESKEVPQEIARQMDKKLTGHSRDETLFSSVFSNGYTGEESSFNLSENVYAAGNLSDSEVLSPSSRHSWDYINRFGSPISSSFSRASCSPESSVCREAKKRLSERWALMSSNGNSQEQKHVRRSSSTLGEMLALLNTKKCVNLEDEGRIKDQESREPLSCLTTDSNKEDVETSPRGLLRSKSVPVLSTVYNGRLNVGVSDPTSSEIDVPKEMAKAKSVKSSLKGKVSSLFFSRNKKSSKGKSLSSQAKVELLSVSSESAGSPVSSVQICDAALQCVNNSLEEYLSTAPCGSSSKTSPDVTGLNLNKGVQPETGLSLAKDVLLANLNDNQSQPSPISVLEPPFEEDGKITQEFSGLVKVEQKGRQVLKSNLIDKSPPIESIARTLSWDDYCAETSTSFPLKSSLGSTVVQEKDESWHVSVETLLSVAGLNGEMLCDSFFARWHSLDSPLDPSLRESYANVSDKEPLREAKRKQLRASRKLVFDSVNTVLAEITGYGSHGGIRGRSCFGVRGSYLENDSLILVDCVWTQMKEWFSEEVSCVSGDARDGDHNSLVVERVLRKEVVGEGWLEQMTLDIDNLGKEIQGQLLEELVEEAVADLTGRI